MRKTRIFALALGALLIAAPLFAQDTNTTTQTTTTQTTTQRDTTRDNGDEWDNNHGSVGLFVDYLRHSPSDTNNWGLGGRFGFAVHPNVHLEGEIAYDFRQSHSTTVAGAFGSATYLADFRVLHGLFGPKFQTNGPVRVFGFVKGGFMNFGITTTGAPAGFVNSFGGVLDGDTHGAIYPGGGVELGKGWFALRGDIGDEMYWAGGDVHHNLRFTIGPTFRF
jgi:hypothetical protein